MIAIQIVERGRSTTVAIHPSPSARIAPLRVAHPLPAEPRVNGRPAPATGRDGTLGVAA